MEDYRNEITQKAAEIIEGDEVKDFETIITCKDGSRKTISWYSRNVHDDNHKSIGSIALGIDITERKQAENALINSEEKYRDVVENSTVAICVIQNDRFKFFNIEAQKLFGYSSNEMKDLNVDTFVCEEDLEVVRSARTRRLRGEEVQDYSHRIKTKEGQVRWVYIKAVAISWEKEAAALVFLTDITERKRAEELMIQTEKMMSVGGLAAGMAHELNNPLGGMLIGVQNVQRRLSPSLPKNQRVADSLGIDLNKFQPYIEEREINYLLNGIQESGKKAKEIILNMLQFSRKSESTMTPTDLPKLMDRALNLATKEYNLNKNIDFRTIRIEKQFDPDLPLINCNQTEIEQVLLNLLANAAWAMANEKGEKQPLIQIRILLESEMIRIEIQDNGPGMDDEAKKRVFEPFYTTKPVGEGTGLGLSVSYMIITNHHPGTMEVKSELEKGTTFIIRLPLRSEE